VTPELFCSLKHCFMHLEVTNPVWLGFILSVLFIHIIKHQSYKQLSYKIKCYTGVGRKEKSAQIVSRSIWMARVPLNTMTEMFPVKLMWQHGVNFINIIRGHFSYEFFNKAENVTRKMTFVRKIRTYNVDEIDTWLHLRELFHCKEEST